MPGPVFLLRRKDAERQEIIAHAHDLADFVDWAGAFGCPLCDIEFGRYEDGNWIWSPMDAVVIIQKEE